MSNRVVIFVDGGNVQSIFALHDIEIELIDYDNLDAEGKTSDEQEKILAQAIKGLKEVY